MRRSPQPRWTPRPTRCGKRWAWGIHHRESITFLQNWCVATWLMRGTPTRAWTSSSGWATCRRWAKSFCHKISIFWLQSFLPPKMTLSIFFRLPLWSLQLTRLILFTKKDMLIAGYRSPFSESVNRCYWMRRRRGMATCWWWAPETSGSGRTGLFQPYKWRYSPTYNRQGPALKPIHASAKKKKLYRRCGKNQVTGFSVPVVMRSCFPTAGTASALSLADSSASARRGRARQCSKPCSRRTEDKGFVFLAAGTCNLSG